MLHVIHETEEESAAISIQKMFRTRIARKRLRDLLTTVVQKVYDPDSGAYYYYNAKTGESSWEKPKAFGEQDVDETVYSNEVTMVEAFDGKQTEGEVLKEVDLESKQEDSVHEAKSTLGHAAIAEDAKDDNHLQIADRKEVRAVNVEKCDSKQDDELPELTMEEMKSVQVEYQPEEMEMLKELFEQIDVDKGGSITNRELSRLLYSLGEVITLEEVNELIAEVDDNGNGELEFDEFLMVLKNQQSRNSYCSSIKYALMFGPKQIHTIRKQFQQLDTDGSGEIDEEELSALIKQLGYRVKDFNLQEIIAEVDDDRNGTINFAEFLHIVYNMRQEKNSRFSKLLDLGIAKGLLNDLSDVFKSTKDRFVKWRFASAVAEEKRNEELERLRQEKLREQKEREERDRKIYQDHQEQQDALHSLRFRTIPGLQYKKLFPGDEETYATKGQFARVHYTGSFENGKVFENSRKRGSAFEFKLGAGHVIEAWEFGIMRMSVGETAEFVCTSNLCYGVKGRPPLIDVHDLEYDVE